MTEDQGPVFDGVRISRPSTGALLAAGFSKVADRPSDLTGLRSLHAVGPKVRLLHEARG